LVARTSVYHLTGHRDRRRSFRFVAGASCADDSAKDPRQRVFRLRLERARLADHGGQAVQGGSNPEHKSSSCEGRSGRAFPASASSFTRTAIVSDLAVDNPNCSGVASTGRISILAFISCQRLLMRAIWGAPILAACICPPRHEGLHFILSTLHIERGGELVSCPFSTDKTRRYNN
jgi:hypothetical protein